MQALCSTRARSVGCLKQIFSFFPRKAFQITICIKQTGTTEALTDPKGTVITCRTCK